MLVDSTAAAAAGDVGEVACDGGAATVIPLYKNLFSYNLIDYMTCIHIYRVRRHASHVCALPTL